MQELAFLNQGVRITIADDRTGEKESYHYDDGLLEFVEHLNRASEPVHADILHLKGDAEEVTVEIALQYSTEYTENVHSYVNNISTTEGGTHLSGFRTALTRCSTTTARKTASSKTSSPPAKTSAKA